MDYNESSSVEQTKQCHTPYQLHTLRLINKTITNKSNPLQANINKN